MLTPTISMLRDIAEDLPAPLFLYDKKRRLCWANTAARERYLPDYTNLLGRVLDEFVPEAAGRRELHERALRGEAIRVSSVAATSPASGRVHYFDMEFRGLRGESGDLDHLLVYAVDVTALRESYRRIRELAQRVESAREDQRRDIARELHEGIAQDLYAMKIWLGLPEKWSPDGSQSAAQSGEFAELLDRCLNAVRRMAEDLRPSALTHLPLSAAIEEHARRMTGAGDLTIRVREIPPFPSLDEAARVIFLRAAQEALRNVTQHAMASRVDITLRVDATNTIMEIADDGVGFDDEALGKPGSLGLLGIRERLATIGGSLLLRCEASGGTTVCVRLPLSDGRGQLRPGWPGNHVPGHTPHPADG